MANDSEPIRYASKVSSQNMESIRGREPLSLTARFELVAAGERCVDTVFIEAWK